MSSLREIKKRIVNITSLENISRSMKMIASIKMLAVKKLIDKRKTYMRSSYDTIYYLLVMYHKFAVDDQLYTRIFASNQLVKDDQYDSNNIEQVTDRDINQSANVKSKVLYIVISSDTGLCGSYNANVIKKLSEQLQADDGNDYMIFPIGHKLISWVAKTCHDKNFGVFLHSDVLKKFDHLQYKLAVNNILDAFMTQQIDKIKIIYTYNINMLNSVVKVKEVLPIAPEVYYEYDIYANVDSSRDLDAFPNLVNIVDFNATAVRLMLFRYVYITLFDCLCNSALSEHTTRFNAMNNANENSKELKLANQLHYNKKRQEMITKELNEIIIGTTDAV